MKIKKFVKKIEDFTCFLPELIEKNEYALYKINDNQLNICLELNDEKELKKEKEFKKDELLIEDLNSNIIKKLRKRVEELEINLENILESSNKEGLKNTVKTILKIQKLNENLEESEKYLKEENLILKKGIKRKKFNYT